MNKNKEEPQHPPVRVADFVDRISDLRDLADMATSLAELSGEVERRFLGPVNQMVASNIKIDGTITSLTGTATITMTQTDISLVTELKTLTQDIRLQLQNVSDSLNRLRNELGLVGNVVGEDATSGYVRQ